ncbi:MAG: glucosaminidase domain-containing protein [Thermoleophilia bacterium]|nr:glucosaminidase domain-containing protein [Thermoleophilia bacterium]
MAVWRVQQIVAAAEAQNHFSDRATPDKKTLNSATEESQDSPVTTLVLTDGQTPLRGRWPGSADQLAVYLLANWPNPSFTVPVNELARYYLYYCNEAELRADLLWAQMIHETAGGSFTGTVRPEQNNFAGLGATSPEESGLLFPTAEAGVMAHIAHMVAYVYRESPVGWANPVVDPRFELVQPRGQVTVLADLNGRWAVPGINYGQSIEEIARLLNAHFSR